MASSALFSALSSPASPHTTRSPRLPEVQPTRSIGEWNGLDLSVTSKVVLMARLHRCVQWSSRMAGSSRVCDASGHCRIGWWRKAAVERLAALGLALVRAPDLASVASSYTENPHGQAPEDQSHRDALHRASQDRPSAHSMGRAGFAVNALVARAVVGATVTTHRRRLACRTRAGIARLLAGGRLVPNPQRDIVRGQANIVTLFAEMTDPPGERP